mmetsp:Transcript_69799/g.225706  ORF Transcript_69799/g.225706 Transcript_69799/m.225706 type:complete len:310 (+) Transcript_69799:432-1361(+)
MADLGREGTLCQDYGVPDRCPGRRARGHCGLHPADKRGTGAGKVRDPRRRGADSQRLAERDAEVAAIPREELVVAAEPLPLQPGDELADLLLREGRHVHCHGLTICMVRVATRLTAEDAGAALAAGSKAPLAAVDFYTGVEGAGACRPEEIIDNLDARVPAHVVDVERHGLLHGPAVDCSWLEACGAQGLTHRVPAIRGPCCEAAQRRCSPLLGLWGACLQQAHKRWDCPCPHDLGLAARPVAQHLPQRPGCAGSQALRSGRSEELQEAGQRAGLGNEGPALGATTGEVRQRARRMGLRRRAGRRQEAH